MKLVGLDGGRIGVLKGDIVTIEIERVGRMRIPVEKGTGKYNAIIPRPDSNAV